MFKFTFFIFGFTFVLCLIAVYLTRYSTVGLSDLSRVEVINRIKKYAYGYEHSGVSVGRGGLRSHYRRKKHCIGTEIEFRVTYTSGKTIKMIVPEDSKRCQALIDFMAQQEKRTGKITSQGKSTSLESSTKSAKIPPVVPKEKPAVKAQAQSNTGAHIPQGLTTSEKMTAPTKIRPTLTKSLYHAGEYKVGVNLPAGEYIIYSTKKHGSYYAVRNNQNEILFNGIAKGALLIELCDGDYFELNDATVQPMENVDLVGINSPCNSLKVGTHIPPGEYMLTSLNGKANAVRVYSSCRPSNENLLSFTYVKDQKFLFLHYGEMIVYVDCKIELVEEHSRTIKHSDTEHTPPQLPHSKEPALLPAPKITYSAGCYIVGTSIPAGEYTIVAEDGRTASFSIRSGQKPQKERVNFAFSGACLVVLFDGEQIELSHGRIKSITETPTIPSLEQSYMLKVGTHIPGGRYQICHVDKSRFAIYYIMDNAMLQFDQACDSDAVFGSDIISLLDGQYVYIENAELTKAPSR